ncbi:nitronate monooxygenase [Legionella anisa]|uniref:Nitronate monooxygenase n=1 Tax=Legionella anisa TaxID=28082 RepID=A0AAX0WZT4_9GAMM|nr:nitronate monooxygenase [Legionella anisa]AWN73656.1 nitronate monooxygenase [Legionella anisa]KTC75772.1 2-nitropropane dioxygenase [Legionella anisa]MBN5935590.1 nitronate monooxygenase [Legionella anisa]MCW8426549.1 nitronate monooxygenase [Legionella anisa]MCW8448212.1 nitronate monooxygenase [Legionella anisa]
MWQTRLTEKIGLRFPIIQAPMAGGATTPELIAAVSNSGGLGSLGAGYMTPAEIRHALKTIRKLTNKPFAVNLFIPEEHSASEAQIQKSCVDIKKSCHELNIEIEPVTKPYAQSFEEQINVILEEKIPVFSYAFGLLDAEWISKLKKNHTILIGTATTLAEARVLEESGIDAIVAQGSEAGGHRGTFIGKAEDGLIGLFSLIPQFVEQIKIPIIAAGGIMDGRGIVAATYLGAEGIQMGTAFLSCFESGIPDVYKHALLTQQHDNTVLTRAFSGKLARGIRNQFIERMEARKINILDYPIQNALTSMMRKKAKEQNDIDFMSMWAGQSAQLCRNMSANELISALVLEAEALNPQACE